METETMTTEQLHEEISRLLAIALAKTPEEEGQYKAVFADEVKRAEVPL